MKRPAHSAASEDASQLHVGTYTTNSIPLGQAIRGDGDADNPGDIDGNGDRDRDDGDSDLPTAASYRYPDADDGEVLGFGRAARSGQKRAISAVVTALYADGTRDDGAAACGLMVPSLSRTLAHTYGADTGSAAPSYLRSTTTCGQLMALLFRHAHAELAEAVTVLAVRVSGPNARVVFSSRKMPASAISLERWRGSWKLLAPLGAHLE